MWGRFYLPTQESERGKQTQENPKKEGKRGKKHSKFIQKSSRSEPEGNSEELVLSGDDEGHRRGA